MDNIEDKFRSLEIEAELQKLKQKLGNSANQENTSTSQSNRTYTSPQNSRSDSVMNEEKRIRFYAILGLQPDASFQEVKQAYKQLVKRCHPDLFFHNPQLRQKAQEVLTKINQAYNEL
jgi:DnaJ-domain-containing protein 1